MFGSHEVPLNIENEGITLSIVKDERVLLYKRECLDEKTEKIILATNGRILINPIEPLSLPKEITTSFLIEFGKATIVEPKATMKIFLKFPVEIGIFTSGNTHFNNIDIFTLMKQKFTLYGDSRNGVICKYCKSDVYPAIPVVNPLQEGVLELEITNTTARWIEVTKAVFNAYGMKIYYSDELVSMRGTMTLERDSAETDLINAPIRPGMKKSLEHYTTRKIPVLTTKFVMEYGL